MNKNGWLSLALVMGLPMPLWGQDKSAGSTTEPVVVTAPPLKAPDRPKPPPKVANEPVISRRSEKAVHTVVNGLSSMGSHVPTVITYYKGFAFVRGSLQEIRVDVVPYRGIAYALVHLPGYPGSTEVVRLGVAKD